MREQDVRFHHIRDHPWPQKLCLKCKRMVPTFHKHYPKDKGDKLAMPTIKEPKQ